MLSKRYESTEVVRRDATLCVVIFLPDSENNFFNNKILS